MGIAPLLLGRYRVSGHSMEPTLRTGDRVLVSRVAFALSGPPRGDVVALRHPDRPEEVLLKRLVGLPGDHFTTEGCETLGIEEGSKEEIATSGDLCRLGPNEYLVLGDRLDHSEDSRHFGAVPQDDILGKAWMRYWPADRVGPLPDIPPDGDSRKRLRMTGP